MIGDLGAIMKKEVLGGGLAAKLGAALLLPRLRGLRKRYDYETYGGAPLLGLRGNCIVSHGRVSRNGIKHAIRAAIEEARADVVGKIAALVAGEVVKQA